MTEGGGEARETLVLYPREYNTRGKEDRHSVRGLTVDGREVNVKLRVPAAYAEQTGAPRISEWAREDVRATNACVRAPDNGPQRREGVLLFSAVEPESEAWQGLPEVYIARWGVVLAHHSGSPDPIFGVGRVDIQRHSRQLMKLEAELERYLANGNTRRAEQVRQSLADPRHFFYSVILYDIERTTRLTEDGSRSFPETLAEAIDQGAREGICGGALVRRLGRGEHASGAVLETQELFARSTPERGGYESGLEVVERMESERTLIQPASGEAVLITPLTRIYAGPRIENFLGREDRYQRLLVDYYDDAEAPQLRRIAVRPRLYPETGVCVFERVYAISPVLGTPRTIDEHGGFSLSPDGGRRAAFEAPRPGDWEEAPAASAVLAPEPRAVWLLEGAGAGPDPAAGTTPADPVEPLAKAPVDPAHGEAPESPAITESGDDRAAAGRALEGGAAAPKPLSDEADPADAPPDHPAGEAAVAEPDPEPPGAPEDVSGGTGSAPDDDLARPNEEPGDPTPVMPIAVSEKGASSSAEADAPASETRPRDPQDVGEEAQTVPRRGDAVGKDSVRVRRPSGGNPSAPGGQRPARLSGLAAYIARRR